MPYVGVMFLFVVKTSTIDFPNFLYLEIFGLLRPVIFRLSGNKIHSVSVEIILYFIPLLDFQKTQLRQILYDIFLLILLKII